MLPLVGTESGRQHYRNLPRHIPPQVNYAVLKYHWATGRQSAALEGLKLFTADLAEQLNTASMAAQGMNGVNDIHGMNGRTLMVSME